MERLSAVGSELEVITQKVEHLKAYHSNLTEDRIMATSKTGAELNYAKVIVEPQVADKKSYPIRWIILLISTLLGGLAGMIFVILRARLSK